MKFLIECQVKKKGSEEPFLPNCVTRFGKPRSCWLLSSDCEIFV